MNLEEILSNEQLRKREFPVVESRIYLAHAAVSPLPRCVTQAMQDYLQAVSKCGQFEYLHRESEEGCRQKFSKLLEVKPEEIALTPSTSASLSMIAEGLKWKPGDTILVREGDFPANIYPWLALERHGVRVKKLPAPAHAELQVEDVLSALDENTRLVSLSSVDYLSGMPIDVEGIGKALQENNVLFCLDAIQSLGAFRTSTRYVDFLAADAHKWLMGPQGVGVLMVKEQHWDNLSPILRGWKTVASPGNFQLLQSDLAPGARRYEPGSLNAAGVVGLEAALSLLLEVGVENIENRIIQLRERLRQVLVSAGMEILGFQGSNLTSGILSFRPNENPLQTKLLHELMLKGGVEVSIRKGGDDTDWIRTAPGFYTTDQEIDRVSNILLKRSYV